MMIVPDVEDVFVPLSEQCLVNPIHSKYAIEFETFNLNDRAIIENLLDSLPKMFAATRVAESCAGAAIQAANLAMVVF
jgi:protein transport protein SEC24